MIGGDATRFNTDEATYVLDLMGNRFLEGVVAQFGYEKVWKACREACGFPAQMVNSTSEAVAVQRYLEQSKKKGSTDGT